MKIKKKEREQRSSGGRWETINEFGGCGKVDLVE
ncbi:hypothetical protein CDSM653_01028 [Caldanaerobacter subterraneus subsp. pacificus DSM 12653]|uniref:Uncharacterized protein n=1 Tax=Caldanaerobacter subterraneus subsp. pacificus DSM 12653 TaxID=391606 RepID=A0A0F5PNF5_9THEO|nr:hypothetical protein CDSM653_01028 [Caldanaerobacter subterraneus subsp. pacificus DSM 12653]